MNKRTCIMVFNIVALIATASTAAGVPVVVSLVCGGTSTDAVMSMIGAVGIMFLVAVVGNCTIINSEE